MILAVATIDTVYLYDTEHSCAIASIGDIHCSQITDLSWSGDAHRLLVTSTDGYVTVICFDDDELGTRLSEIGGNLVVRMMTNNSLFTMQFSCLEMKEFGVHQYFQPVDVASPNGSSKKETTSKTPTANVPKVRRITPKLMKRSVPASPESKAPIMMDLTGDDDNEETKPTTQTPRRVQPTLLSPRPQ